MWVTSTQLYRGGTENTAGGHRAATWLGRITGQRSAQKGNDAYPLKVPPPGGWYAGSLLIGAPVAVFSLLLLFEASMREEDEKVESGTDEGSERSMSQH